jgi:hypothetical protein
MVNLLAVRTLCLAALSALIASTAPVARADRDPPILRRGDLLFGAALEANLERNQDADPITVARARYGIGARWTAGLVASLGLTGAEHPLCTACDHPRGGVFADGAFLLAERPLARIAARARAGTASFDPLHLAVTIGGSGRVGSPRVWLDFDPYVSIAASGRESGNDDFVELPVWLWVRPIDPLRLSLRSGVSGPLSGFSDSWTTPLGAGAAVAVGRWEIGIEAVFPRLIGPLNSGRFRNAFAFVRVELPTGGPQDSKN